MTEAEKLCDRIGIIISGVLAMEGTLAEILERTSTKELEDAFFELYKMHSREEIKMRGVKNIVKKELTRVFTDRKLVINLFILPGVLIMVMYSIMGNLISKMEKDIQTHVPTIYIQNAPEDFSRVIDAVGFEGKITYLKADESTDGIKDGILKGDIDLLVVFDEGFRETINNYKQAGDPIPEVRTFYNPAEDYSNAAKGNFTADVLYAYQQVLLAERLGNIEQLQVFYIDRDPEAGVIVDKNKAGGKFLAMLLPFLINIMLFQGPWGLAWIP